MAKYKMDDGTIVNTDRAMDSWEEDTRWNGNNNISVPTGSQWEHETLYKSAKGRYYIEHYSQMQGSLPYAMYIAPVDAAAWLIQNDEELPEDLKHLASEVEE